MKTIYLTSICMLAFASFAISQTEQRPYRVSEPVMKKGGTVVSAIADPVLFVQQNMIGPCVTVSNVVVNRPSKSGAKPYTSIASWSDSLNTLGIDSGMIITTGDALSVIGPVSDFLSGDLQGTGDALLSAMCGSATYDAVSIEFDFIPQADSIIPFEFIWGSEEYKEYVNSGYNDIFGFFISGPGYTGLQNIAYIPGTNLPISIDNVNHLANTQYYIDNEALTGTFLAYDGYTTVFSLSVPVMANQQYHFKVVVADALDRVLDSGVILKMGSFAGNIIAPAPSFTYTVNGNNVSFANTTTNGMSYLWDFGDGSFSTDVNPVHNYSQTGTYTLRLTASNHCYTEEVEVVIDLTSTYTGFAGNSEITVSSITGNGLFAFDGVNGNVSTKVYTIDGRRVLPGIQQNGNRMMVDLSGLEKGVYIVNLNSKTYKLLR